MKWQQIAGLTDELNTEAKKALDRKRQQDAAVLIPNIWSEIVNETTTHLNEAKNNLEVAVDKDSGSISCIAKFDPMHEDSFHNNKPFSSYIIEKFNKRAENRLKVAKNPYVRNALVQKIGEYRLHLQNNLLKTEAKIIHDKRYSMAIDAAEKFSKSTYYNPEEYQQNLQDTFVAINSLSLPEYEKDALKRKMREQISFNAGLGTLHVDPESLINPDIEHPWKEGLNISQIIKLENQARNILNQQSRLTRANIKNISKSHFESILNTGMGVIGFDDLLRRSVPVDDQFYIDMQEKERLHYETFEGLQQLKYLPLSDSAQILNSFAPKVGDKDYHEKQRMYDLLVREFKNQKKLSEQDPAKFVEILFSDELGPEMSFTQRLMLRKQLQEDKGLESIKYLTAEERKSFLSKIQSIDPEIVKTEIDKIISLGDENNKIGLEVLDEILKNENEKLKIPIYFYAKNQMLGNSVADDFLQIIPRQKELFSMQSTAEKNLLKKGIDNNETYVLWKKKMLMHQPYNIGEVDITDQGIRQLARFYQMSEQINEGQAVEKAVEKIIDDNYITKVGSIWDWNSFLSKLVLPKKIIQDGVVHEIDEAEVRNRLLKIRKDIIDGKIKFDVEKSLGEKGQESSIKNVLLNIKAILNKEKKAVYFCVWDGDEYNVLMANENQPLEFNLLD